MYTTILVREKQLDMPDVGTEKSTSRLASSRDQIVVVIVLMSGCMVTERRCMVCSEASIFHATDLSLLRSGSAT